MAARSNDDDHNDHNCTADDHDNGPANHHHNCTTNHNDDRPGDRRTDDHRAAS